MQKIAPFVILVLLLMAVSCKNSEENAPKGNAVYFWRTSFELSLPEKEFLKENNITALYVKFFDVVGNDESIRPENTLVFKEKFPDNCEIIPTVFIDSKAFAGREVPENLSAMIVARIDTMLTKNGYKVSKEIEIDFDWTKKNRDQYFKILSEIRDILHSQERLLSTTIRLHQLSQPIPPADYGALMVYNTGDFSSNREYNSILSMKAVEPYLKHLPGYELPLVAALPIYSWNLLYRNDRFVVITRGINEKDTTWFSPIDGNKFRVRKYGSVPGSSGGYSEGVKLTPGDILRHEEASYQLLDSVENVLRRVRPGILGRVILYHLDEKSISNYNNNEINKIYSRN